MNPPRKKLLNEDIESNLFVLFPDFPTFDQQHLFPIVVPDFPTLINNIFFQNGAT